MLDCVLKRDMKYFRPNPKFHHWITDDKRFGLTFQRSDDAKAFNKGIKIAVADLTDGWYCKIMTIFINYWSVSLPSFCELVIWSHVHQCTNKKNLHTK